MNKKPAILLSSLLLAAAPVMVSANSYVTHGEGVYSRTTEGFCLFNGSSEGLSKECPKAEEPVVAAPKPMPKPEPEPKPEPVVEPEPVVAAEEPVVAVVAEEPVVEAVVAADPMPVIENYTDQVGVYFETDSAVISDTDKGVLDTLVDKMMNAEGLEIGFITITGHTDDVGTDEYNQVLSEARAKSVADYLMTLGLEERYFVVKGEGESSPIFSNDTAANREFNRRTVVVVTAEQFFE